MHDLIPYAVYHYEAYEQSGLLERDGFNVRYAILVMNVIVTCGIRVLPLKAKKNNMKSTGEILKGTQTVDKNHYCLISMHGCGER